MMVKYDVWSVKLLTGRKTWSRNQGCGRLLLVTFYCAPWYKPIKKAKHDATNQKSLHWTNFPGCRSGAIWTSNGHLLLPMGSILPTLPSTKNTNKFNGIPRACRHNSLAGTTNDATLHLRCYVGGQMVVEKFGLQFFKDFILLVFCYFAGIALQASL